jgi:hypothetical protein
MRWPGHAVERSKARASSMRRWRSDGSDLELTAESLHLLGASKELEQIPGPARSGGCRTPRQVTVGSPLINFGPTQAELSHVVTALTEVDRCPAPPPGATELLPRSTPTLG